MSQPVRAPIPKFGSFHPKQKSSAKVDGRGGDPASSNRTRDSHRSRKRDRETAGEDPSDRKDEYRSQHDKSTPSDHRDVARHSVPDRTVDNFIVDRRGDPKNAEYGSLHRYDVPLYHRVGSGRVLGASPRVRLRREQGPTREAVLVHEDHHLQTSIRPLTSKSMRVLSKLPERRLKTRYAYTWNLNSDEVHFAPQMDEGTQAGIETFDLVDYRSIDGRAKLSDAPEQDGDVESDSDIVDDPQASTGTGHTQQENARLIRQTRDHPKTILPWLNLIDLQKHVLFPNKDAGRLTTSERRALADVRLSIYAQAEKHFPKSTSDMDVLIAGIMEERRMLLDSSQLSAKWLDVLRDHPNSIKLRIKYLDHVQGDYSSFRLESCKAGHIHCLRIIAEVAPKMSDPSLLLSDQVYILLRLTALLRDADYAELANSVWQALLELSVPSPQGIKFDNTDLATFEAFWDSDVARIGEDGALGFERFKIDGGQNSRTRSNEAVAPQRRTFATEWALQEMTLASTCFLPGPVTEDTDDPFRVVMFSDIKDIITPLLPGIPIHSLVDAFLLHHFLPPTNRPDGDRRWQTDQYLNREISQAECRPASRFWLFSTAFDSFKSTMKGPYGSDTTALRFVDRVLDKLCSDHPDLETLAEYYIAFKMHVLPDEMKRAKRLLKARPDSLRLYNAYALAEANLGRSESARQVWQAASNMTVSGRLAQQQHKCEMFLTWAQVEIEADREKDVLTILARMCGSTEVETGTASSSVIRLRVSQDLQHYWVIALDHQLYQSAVSAAELSAWFTYVTAGHDLHVTLDTLRQRTAILLQREAMGAVELVHEARTRILAHHMKCHRAYKPALIRDELRESIRLFPDNTLFLRTHAEHESRFDLNDRIKAPFREELMNDDAASLSKLTFAIDQELIRYNQSAGGSSEHSVRSLFVQTLLQPSTAQHSLGLWRKWFLFEHPTEGVPTTGVQSAAQTERKMARAKQVFLDGLRYLPWHKGWALLGMRSQWGAGGMTERELEQVYDTLYERELRVRVDMR